jgi:hypothetical protein
MAKTGLGKWFAEKWVDIGSKKRMVHFQNVDVLSNKRMQNESIQSVFHLLKLVE